MRLCLIFLLLLLGPASAGPKDKRPGPPVPDLQGFVAAQALLPRVRQVVGTLAPGLTFARPTPDGPRRAVEVVSGGQVVSWLLLAPDGTIAPRGSERRLPDASPVALDGPVRAALQGRLRSLPVSTFVRVEGGRLTFFLLDAGEVAAELHLDARTGAVLPDPGAHGKPLRKP